MYIREGYSNKKFWYWVSLLRKVEQISYNMGTCALPDIYTLYNYYTYIHDIASKAQATDLFAVTNTSIYISYYSSRSVECAQFPCPPLTIMVMQDWGTLKYQSVKYPN